MSILKELQSLPRVVRYKDLDVLSPEARRLVFVAGRELGDDHTYRNWVDMAIFNLEGAQ